MRWQWSLPEKVEIEGFRHLGNIKPQRERERERARKDFETETERFAQRVPITMQVYNSLSSIVPDSVLPEPNCCELNRCSELPRGKVWPLFQDFNFASMHAFLPWEQTRACLFIMGSCELCDFHVQVGACFLAQCWRNDERVSVDEFSASRSAVIPWAFHWSLPPFVLNLSKADPLPFLGLVDM